MSEESGCWVSPNGLDCVGEGCSGSQGLDLGLATRESSADRYGPFPAAIEINPTYQGESLVMEVNTDYGNTEIKTEPNDEPEMKENVDFVIKEEVDTGSEDESHSEPKPPASLLDSASHSTSDQGEASEDTGNSTDEAMVDFEIKEEASESDVVSADMGLSGGDAEYVLQSDSTLNPTKVKRAARPVVPTQREATTSMKKDSRHISQLASERMNVLNQVPTALRPKKVGRPRKVRSLGSAVFVQESPGPVDNVGSGPSVEMSDSGAKNTPTTHECSLCHKSFRRLAQLHFHEKRHGEVVKFGNVKLDFNFKKVLPVKSSQDSKKRKKGKKAQTYRDLKPKKKGDGPHSCNLCGKIFTFVWNLKRHEEILHKGGKDRSCQICGNTFVFMRDLKKHLRIEHGKIKHGNDEEGKVRYRNVEHKCIVCHKLLKSKYSLKDHMGLHTGKKPYVCDICGMGFFNKPGLRRHEKIHSEAPAYVCKVCGKGFHERFEMERHMKGHDGPQPETYDCPKCNRSFPRASHLKCHMRIHDEGGEKNYLCSICGKGLLSKHTLSTHMKCHTRGNTFTCTVCGRVLSNAQNLKAHEKSHSGKKDYHCSTCGQTFSYGRSLRAHEETHKVKKDYQCTICGKEFAVISNLTSHEKTHKDKRYFCSFCGKAFWLKCRLKRHEKIHTGEKKHICSVCGKGFVQGNNLIQHEKIHTGQRDHQCTFCGKAFVQSSNLKVHMKQHTREPDTDDTVMTD